MSLGSDFAGVESIDWNMTFLEGEEQERRAAAEAFARRFNQGRNTVFYDPTYGLDLRMLVADNLPVPVAKGMIQAEGVKEERVTKVDVDIVIEEDGSWVISITPTFDDGSTVTRTFVATADKVTLLLEEDPPNALI